VRIHGWGCPGEVSVSVDGSVGEERYSRQGKSPRKDDSVDSALLFKEEDILKVKKEKSPWSIRTDCVFAWLGVVVLGSFFLSFSRSPFFGGEPRGEWGKFAIAGWRLVPKRYYLGRASVAADPGARLQMQSRCDLRLGQDLDGWGW
jgi:hypothetical protein